jgi:hypothetical protein
MAKSRIDIDRFIELYRKYGDGLTWAKYAEKLSTEEVEITPGQVSGFVSLNRERLKKRGVVIEPRQKSISPKWFPWPNADKSVLNRTRLYRYLQNCGRAEAFGEEILDDRWGSLTIWRAQRARYEREHQVIRFDPDRGLYLSLAHKDETPAEPESMKYFYQRHPKS